MIESTMNAASAHRQGIAEALVILALCFAVGGTPTPAVNEAHYLAKAKHYWNRSWCAGDQFLESADAHGVFYWSFGWLTRFVSLPATAWIGRLLVWSFFAVSWQRLSVVLVPGSWYSVLSAGLLILGTQRCHLAGEWLIGGIEAKGFAFGFLFLSLELLLRNRWNWAGICLGIATSFHVLVGGWSMLAAIGAWIACGPYRPRISRLIPGIVLGTVATLPGLIPALLLTWGQPAEIVRDANAIYVYERLAHHLLFHRLIYDHTLPLFPLLRHLSLLVVWLSFAYWTPCRIQPGRLGQRPLRGFVGTAVAIAIVGAMLDQSLLAAPDLAASVLRYYWFRLSDVMLPAGMALAVMGAVFVWQRLRPEFSQWLGLAVSVLVLTNTLLNIANRAQDWRRQACRESLGGAEFGFAEHPQLFDSWRRMCEWASHNTDPQARFLTPRWQQTFKWFAGRSEVVTWKDIPQDAKSIVEWWDRLAEACPPIVSANGIAALPDDRIRELALQYSFQFVVVDTWMTDRPFSFRRVYPATGVADYEIYEVTPAVDSLPKLSGISKPTLPDADGVAE